MAIIIMLDNQYWNRSARMAILEWRTSNVYINHYKILRTSNLTSKEHYTILHNTFRQVSEGRRRVELQERLRL